MGQLAQAQGAGRLRRMSKIPAQEWWTRERKDRAKPILLEKSPHEVDRGELIGRDPRQISAPEFDAAGIAGAPILAVIRAKCLDCCGEQQEEVRKCVAFSCPNWPYRMGSNPFHTVKLTDEERARRSARLRAGARAKMDRAPSI